MKKLAVNIFEITMILIVICIEAVIEFWKKHIVSRDPYDPYNSDTVMDFVKQAWKITEDMNAAKTNVEIDWEYFQLKEMLETYSGLVPANVMMNHDCRLYHLYHERKAAINKKIPAHHLAN